MDPAIKGRLYNGSLAFVEGSGCPVTFYHDGSKPQLLFQLSNECKASETPILLSPDKQPNAWLFKTIPSNCIKQQAS
jgi:hypothetical protein